MSTASSSVLANASFPGTSRVSSGVWGRVDGAENLRASVGGAETAGSSSHCLGTGDDEMMLSLLVEGSIVIANSASMSFFSFRHASCSRRANYSGMINQQE